MKFYRVNALLLKYFYLSINSADRLFDVFYWPIIDLLIWGFASFYITSLSEVNVLSMFLGGMILWVFIWRASQDLSVYLLEDFWSKNLYNLFSSPVRLSEIITSLIIMGFIRSLVSFAVLSLLAYLLYAFNIFSVTIVFLAFAVFLLSLMGWIIGMFIMSMIFFFGQRIQVLAWSVVWVIQPFSCVFYPISALPPWAAVISRSLPTTYIFENMRSVINHGTVSYSSLAYSFGLSLVLLFLVALLLMKAFKHAKKTGLLAKSG